MFYLKLTFTLVVCLIIFFIGKAWFKTKKSNPKKKDSNQQYNRPPSSKAQKKQSFIDNDFIRNSIKKGEFVVFQ